MSTQSPTPPTPKGPRNNNRRNPKRNTTPSMQKATLLATPPSSPPRNVSPGGTATDSSINANLPKKNGRSNKKPRDAAPKASPAAQRNGHQRTSSQTNGNSTPQFKDSPHYAGPTFHASPAPSALPMPSFFSKSLPESELAPTLESDTENLDMEPDVETTPSKPRSRPQFSDESQKSTPLDFLFKAAVEARHTQPQNTSETNPRIRTPQTDSKTFRERVPKDVPNAMFPFEMGSPESRNSHIGPSFATSYKERMSALRSSGSHSPPTEELDEDQRRAKTEALKSLLLNPRPQRPSSASNFSPNPPTNYRERPNPNPTVPHFATPIRTTSGPPGPVSHDGLPRERNQPIASPHMYSDTPQQFHHHNSVLRHEVLTSKPGNAQVLPKGSFASVPPPYAPFDHSKGPSAYAQSPTQPPHPTQSLDTKQMENDLRRILKLDAKPGFPSNGIQSSYA